MPDSLLSPPQSGDGHQGGGPKPGEGDNQPKPGEGEGGNQPKPGEGEGGNQPKPGEGEGGNQPKPGEGEGGNQPKPGEGEGETGPKPGEGEGETADEPIEYEAFAVPEGVELDQEVLGAFTEVAAEARLSQDQAQKLLDIHVGQQEAVRRAAEEQVAAWEKAVRSDPHHEQTLEHARKALREHADEETQELLGASAVGSHPGVIKLLAKFGELLSDDRFLEPQVPDGSNASLAQRIYGRR